MADDTIRLIEAAHRGDKSARDRLVTENMGLIWSIVRRFSGRGYELEDLFQIGSIGLLKAYSFVNVQTNIDYCYANESLYK